MIYSKKLFAILTFVSFMGFFQDTKAQISHKSFTEILEKHVSEAGFVNYNLLKKNEQDLDHYLNILAKHTPKSNWTRNEKMAYLINTYNAYTLKLILKNYPVESIKDIGGIFSNPFTTNFIPFENELISLDDVEKGMLLKMNDPRIHFAINCASKSCPKLQNEAFEAKKLNDQLEKATKEFILSNENSITKNKLQLSKIFKWYTSDFEAQSVSIQDFIDNYVDEKISADAEILFTNYSWKLNGK